MTSEPCELSERDEGGNISDDNVLYQLSSEIVGDVLKSKGEVGSLPERQLTRGRRVVKGGKGHHYCKGVE